MAPNVLLALFAMLLAGEDGPVATQAKPPAPPPAQTAPAAAPAPAPPPGANFSSILPVSNAPPNDDYGYAAWCYGALSGYVALYDQAMPEVTRIEREFPGPNGADEDLKVYPQLLAQARADLKVYGSAIAAAEKASPRPIAPYGAAAARRGMAYWNGARAAPKARLAQMWMSWSPPEKCDTVAARLKSKASVLGQALAANTPDASTLEPDATPPTGKVVSATSNLVFQPVTPAATTPAPPALPQPAPTAPASAAMAPAAAEAPASTPAPAQTVTATPPPVEDTGPLPPLPPPPPSAPVPEPEVWYRGQP